MSSMMTDVMALASAVIVVNVSHLQKRHDWCLTSAHEFESTREGAGTVVEKRYSWKPMPLE